MLKLFVQQVNGLVMGLYTRACLLVTVQVLPSVNKLRACIIQVFQSVVSLFSQLSQHVRTVISQKKDQLVELIKLVRSHISGSKTAQTHTDLQSTVDGLKSAAAAKQRRPRAKAASKKGK